MESSKENVYGDQAGAKAIYSWLFSPLKVELGMYVLPLELSAAKILNLQRLMRNLIFLSTFSIRYCNCPFHLYVLFSVKISVCRDSSVGRASD